MGKELKEYKKMSMVGFSLKDEQDKYYDGLSEEKYLSDYKWDNIYKDDRECYEDWLKNMEEDQADLWLKNNGSENSTVVS